jgi:dTDP-4-amino-4,6-dideoxygalactose transaminase
MNLSLMATVVNDCPGHWRSRNHYKNCIFRRDEPENTDAAQSIGKEQKMKIKPMIPLLKVFMSPNVDKPLLDVIHSGWIGEGPKVQEFEANLKAYSGNAYLVTVNTGTSALHLAYHIALYPNDRKGYRNSNESEIISTPVTCTATNTPIINNGAKIVWADVDPITGSISPEDVERKITKYTKAVVMVHWGGNPCDMEKINLVAEAYGIKVIEDAAHAMGMEYKGNKIGKFSDFTACSLQAIKHITSTDGGILFLKIGKDFERAKLLRWYGIDRTVREDIDLRCEVDVPEAGYKFHMNDVCAVIGNENFKHLNWIIAKHRENAAFYNEAFKGYSAITTIPENPDGKATYWLYTFHVNNRDELMVKLKKEGIMSSKVHARNDTHSMFAEFRAELPGVERFNSTHLCIPVGWWVNHDERTFIADMVIKYAS